MKKREIIALCFMVAGGAMEAVAYTNGQSELLHGVGALAFMFGIAIEIIGIAIVEDSEKPRKK